MSGAAPGRSQRFLLGHSSDSGRWRADFVGHSEGRPVSEGDRAPGGDLPCPHKAPHLQNRHLRATAHCSRAHPGAHHSRLQRAESWTTAGRAFGANVPPGIQQSSCSAPPAKQATIIPNAKSRTGSLRSWWAKGCIYHSSGITVTQGFIKIQANRAESLQSEAESPGQSKCRDAHLLAPPPLRLHRKIGQLPALLRPLCGQGAALRAPCPQPHEGAAATGVSLISRGPRSHVGFGGLGLDGLWPWPPPCHHRLAPPAAPRTRAHVACKWMQLS